ncbi:MFS transporter [Microbispora sp. NPDC046933]|uniref:MFS transporter n=1 Tax=Microbispora sp. NPDC046933 TaxID=3155618 RepID=UPI0034098A9A
MAHSPIPRAAAETPSGAPARRGRVRWIIAVVITLLAIINYIDRGALSVAMPDIREDLGFNATTSGVILSAFVWPYAVMNLPSGWLVDRFGPRVIMTFAIGAWSICCAVTGAMHTVATFVAARVGLGVSEAPMFPAAVKGIGTWFHRSEKGTATSMMIAGTQVGLAASPPVATALMLAFGWRAMFVLLGLLGVIGVVGWLAVYRSPEKHPWLSASELAHIRGGQGDDAAPAADAPVTSREWVSLFRHRSLWTMIIGDFALQYLFWFYITWLPTYLQTDRGFTIENAGLVAALPYIAGAVGALVGGRFSDSLAARIPRIDARRYTIAGGALLTALALLATATTSGAVLAVTLLTIGMFTYSLTGPSIWALATDVVRTQRFVGSVGSIQNFGGFLGGAVAPITTGMIVDASGSFGLALLAAGVLALVAAAMYGLVLRRPIPV